MSFWLCASECSSFLTSDEVHDHCLTCLGRKHAETAFVDGYAKVTALIHNETSLGLYPTQFVGSTLRLHWLGTRVVSASDVTKVETLKECRGRHWIDWILQDFRETFVSRSLTFRLETKMLWRQTPSQKKRAIAFTTVTTSAYQDQLNTGFSKVCEIFTVCGI